MNYTDKFTEIINIVLSEKNVQHFVNVMTRRKKNMLLKQKSEMWSCRSLQTGNCLRP